MTKIFKSLLVLCVLWFAVPYFYHSYLDYQVFSKIEKEYCEKDAGLMVYVDKIDFSQPIVIVKKGEDEKNTEIVGESRTELQGNKGSWGSYFIDGLDKQEIYFDLRQPYLKGGHFFDKPKKVTKEFFTINGEHDIYKETNSGKCLRIKGNKLRCLDNDIFTLAPSKMPTKGILIEDIIYRSKVVFNDYVIEERSFIGKDIPTQKILFSFKNYNYGGSIGLAKTYDPYEEGIFGTNPSITIQHSCTGETNPQSIPNSRDFLTGNSNFLRYLKEHYGYK